MTDKLLPATPASHGLSTPASPAPSPMGSFNMQSFAMVDQMATRFAQSGLYGQMSPAQAFVILQAGIDMGCTPTEAMSGIHVIKGKAVVSGQLMVNRVNRAGHKFEVVDSTTTGATVRITRKDNGATRTVTFNEADAKAAGLFGKDNWKNYPRPMYLNRAISECVRYICPEILGGTVHTEADFDAVIIGDRVIEDPSTVTVQTIKSAIEEEWDGLDSAIRDYYPRLGLADKVNGELTKRADDRAKRGIDKAIPNYRSLVEKCKAAVAEKEANEAIAQAQAAASGDPLPETIPPAGPAEQGSLL